jgi:hypothetical protein
LNLQTSLSEKSESDSIEYLDLVKNSKSRPTRATAAKNGENRSLGDTHIEPINAISPRVPVGISETSPLSPPHMRLPISPSFPASSSHANAMDSVTRGLPPNPLGGSLTNEYRPPRPPGTKSCCSFLWTDVQSGSGVTIQVNPLLAFTVLLQIAAHSQTSTQTLHPS